MSSKSSVRPATPWATAFLAATLASGVGLSDEQMAALIADRAAVERVYYHHRLGNKLPFEQLMPADALEHLTRQDSRNEAVLSQVYGIEITAAMVDAEVCRINATTRAPDMLAEIKTALGNDPARFARAMAKPTLVERCLRDQFDRDDALHAPQRRQVEQTRDELLAVKQSGADCEELLAILIRRHSNGVTETTWQLGARPAESNAPAVDEFMKRSGPNAQVLASPETDGKARGLYFEDLPDELQHVLRAQLRRSGDVSAVIEIPRGFLLYVLKEKTDAALSAAGLFLPKRSYEQWLEEQSAGKSVGPVSGAEATRSSSATRQGIRP